MQLVKKLSVSWHARRMLKCFDFFGTKWFREEACVVERLEYTPADWVSAKSGVGEDSRWYLCQKFFVVVTTSRGQLCIPISKRTHSHMYTVETLKVRYRQGRWTGNLKGKIVH